MSSSQVLPTKLGFKSKVRYQRMERRDQVRELMAATRTVVATTSSQSKEFNNIKKKEEKEKFFDSSSEDVINVDNRTTRVMFKRCRLKQRKSNLLNEGCELIKRSENLKENECKNDNLDKKSKRQEYIYQLSPFTLIFTHQSNTVKPSLSQTISDSRLETREEGCLDCQSSRDKSCCSCYCFGYRSNENKMKPCSIPEELLYLHDYQKEKENENEEKEEESRLGNKYLRRKDKKQDNKHKFMSTKVFKSTSSLNVLILFSIILLVSKKNTQRCDIGRCESTFVMGFAGATKYHGMKTTTTTLTTTAESAIKQTFRTKPESSRAYEGEPILLKCEVDNQQGEVQWTKDGDLLFHSNGKKDNELDFPNHHMIGNVTNGEHSIEIEHSREVDSGLYICQVSPPKAFIDTGLPEDKYLIAKANVTIFKRILTNQLVDSDTFEQQNDTSPGSPSSSTKIIKDIAGLDDLISTVHNSATTSQLQARDIPNSAKLPSNGHINQFAGPTYLKSHYITPQASSASISPTSFQSLNLIISWPYLLLLIAVMLMLANIYLIYSLVQRHKRQKEGFSQQTDNSLESGSNGGCSATGSAGTGSSRLGTNELSGCELEHSIDVPVEMQNTFSVNRICDQQFQQQQQQQQQQQLQLQQQQKQINMNSNIVSLPQTSSISSLTPLPLTLPLHQNMQDLQQQQQQHPHQFHHQLQNQQLQLSNHQAWNGHEFIAIDSNGWVLEI